jgi:3-phenylpropionate/trans-cinnamate dioxygenase ferredoxin subunit
VTALVAPAFVDVGRAEDFPLGRPTRVDIPGKDVFVLRADEDTWFAIKNTCPHHGAPLCLGTTAGTWLPSAPGEYVYGFENRVIRCPYHGYEYDLETGRALFVPHVRERVVRYEVLVEDGRVRVSLKGKRA